MISEERIEELCWTELDSRLLSFARAIEAEHDNDVIERCAVLCEKSDRYRGDYFAEKIRALKQ